MVTSDSTPSPNVWSTDGIDCPRTKLMLRQSMVTRTVYGKEDNVKWTSSWTSCSQVQWLHDNATFLFNNTLMTLLCGCIMLDHFTGSYSNSVLFVFITSQQSSVVMRTGISAWPYLFASSCLCASLWAPISWTLRTITAWLLAVHSCKIKNSIPSSSLTR